MKFTTQRETILDVLKTISPICAIKTSFRVCDCCLIRVADGSIEISCTDASTISANARMAADIIQEEGNVCVDARHLQAVIMGLPKGTDIHFESDNGRLKLAAERFKSSLPVMDVSEFPHLNFDMPKNTVSISASDLRDALKSTLYCVSKDMSRPDFTGTQISVTDGGLSFVATDGSRLSWFQCELPTGAEDFEPFIFPATAQKVMLTMLKDGDVRMALGKNNKLHIECGEIRALITGICGEFPNFRRVLPNSFDYTAEVDRQQLATALGLLGNFGQNTEGGTLHCTACHFGDGRIILETHSDTKGEVSNEIDADTSGKGESIGLNAKYMLDAVSTLHDEQIRISITDAYSPVLFIGVDESRLKQIIMPMQL